MVAKFILYLNNTTYVNTYMGNVYYVYLHYCYSNSNNGNNKHFTSVLPLSLRHTVESRHVPIGAH